MFNYFVKTTETVYPEDVREVLHEMAGFKAFIFQGLLIL